MLFEENHFSSNFNKKTPLAEPKKLQNIQYHYIFSLENSTEALVNKTDEVGSGDSNPIENLTLVDLGTETVIPETTTFEIDQSGSGDMPEG